MINNLKEQLNLLLYMILQFHKVNQINLF